MIPLYDLDGTVCGIDYNGTAYYFYKNLQGDVIAITDDTGATVAKYRYDAWGKCTIVSDSTYNGFNEGIATINPFRYRSYYYDNETGWYYLQSRYYDPNIGRFINADDPKIITNLQSTDNLYAYCNNSPINDFDPNGNIGWQTFTKVITYIFDFISRIIETAGSMSKEMQDAIKAIKNAKRRGASKEWIKLLKKKKKALMKPKILGIGKLKVITSLLQLFITVFPYLSYLKKIDDGITMLAEFFVEIAVEIIGMIGNGFATIIGKVIPYAGFLLGWALGLVVDIVIEKIFDNGRMAKITKSYTNKVKNSANWKFWVYSLGDSIKASF